MSDFLLYHQVSHFITFLIAYIKIGIKKTIEDKSSMVLKIILTR